MYFNLYLFVGVEVGLSIPSLAAAELAWLALGVEDTGCNVLRISDLRFLGVDVGVPFLFLEFEDGVCFSVLGVETLLAAITSVSTFFWLLTVFV